MTSVQLYFAVGIPVVTILACMIVGIFQLKGLRSDIREIRCDIKTMTGKIADIDARLGRLVFW